jgi:hypothetical protein
VALAQLEVDDDLHARSSILGDCGHVGARDGEEQ